MSHFIANHSPVQFAVMIHNERESMHLNRPQVACKVVLVNEVFSLGPGETKTIVEDLDVNHYDRNRV